MRLKHFLRLGDTLRSIRPAAVDTVSDRIWRRMVEAIGRSMDDWEPRFNLDRWIDYVMEERR